MLLHPAIFSPTVVHGALPQDVTVVYPIDCSNRDTVSARYQEIYTGEIAHSFCICLNVHGLTAGSEMFTLVLDYAVSVSFHHKYFRFNPNKPLLLFQAADAFMESMDMLQKAFTAQGFAGMDYMLIDASNENNRYCSDSRLTLMAYDEDKADFATGWLKVVGNAQYADGVVAVKSTKDHSLQQVIEKITAAESIFCSRHPQACELLRLQRKYANEVSALQHAVSILKDKNQSLESYQSSSNIPDSELKKQVREILKFYDKEYEILPMWYKQFGHIIKVLSGRRSFRSLFNDNVKKYKD